MKQILTVILIISALSCKAQVAPLYMADPELPTGTYYKDLNNDLDKFVGIWKWEQGNSYWIMTLQKIEHYYDGDFYHDILIGEYEYIENGNTVINTLNLLNDPTIEADYHNISGTAILHKFHPLPCDDCTLEERRVQLFFDDPQETYKQTRLWLRHRIINGVEQIDARLYGYREIPENNNMIEDDNGPIENNGGVPFGEYTLI